jgi:hypothetical protein
MSDLSSDLGPPDGAEELVRNRHLDTFRAAASSRGRVAGTRIQYGTPERIWQPRHRLSHANGSLLRLHVVNDRRTTEERAATPQKV